jgi:hypothetical protein
MEDDLRCASVHYSRALKGKNGYLKSNESENEKRSLKQFKYGGKKGKEVREIKKYMYM